MGARAAVAAGLIALCACSLAGPSGGRASEPAAVALRQADVPAGMARCKESGDIPSFLGAARKKSPESFQQIDDEWKRLQSEGVQKGEVDVFSDDPNQCTALLQATGGSARVLINFVVTFKDAGAAERAYKGGLLGITPASAGQQQGVQQGDATGLSANSLVYNQSLGGQALYLALWQARIFDVFFFGINVPSADARRAAAAVNGRIA